MTCIASKFCSTSPKAETTSDCDKYIIELFDSIRDVEDEWAFVSAAHDVFYDIDFLRCIEKCPATGIEPYYGLVKEDGHPVGIIYFQSKHVKLRENLRKPGPNEISVVQKMTDPLRQAVVNSINFHTVVCGNLLLTGKYGFYFKDHINRDEQFNIITNAADKLQQYLKTKGTDPGLVLIKDFFVKDLPTSLKNQIGFTKFSVQPKMILDLDPAWKTFDDYLLSLKSKYRVRAKKAVENAREIVKKTYTVDEIAEHRETIHALYKNVSDQADFNAFVLHPAYFENIQAALGKNMKFTTYWKGDKMVAFYTSIKNFDILDAHFLGYDPTENVNLQIYLNMLYDLIKEGIAQNVKQVDMSRTAVEIKSTVGAVPHEMFLFIKHSNNLINKSVEHIVGFIKPEAEYIIRSPFK